MATADLLTDQQLTELEYDKTVRADIELFRSQAHDFTAGKLTADEFRPFRLRRGIYSQRQDAVHMIRTKIPGGLLTTRFETSPPARSPARSPTNPLMFNLTRAAWPLRSCTRN